MEGLIGLAVLAALLAALFAFLAWRRGAAEDAPALLAQRLERLEAGLGTLERSLRDEQRAGRAELAAQLDRMAQRSDERLAALGLQQDERLRALGQQQGEENRAARSELAASQQRLAEANDRGQVALREALERKLAELQQGNEAKLEQMRATVDEKLQSTLNARLDASFKLVSERLEQVHAGLGEMRTLATGVGDLKRVLGNVKSRGVFGEVQLAAILDELLTPEQYATNVATRPGSSERVEFAVKLPGPGEAPVWLPLDAKFPREDYERLLDAQERADAEAAAQAGAALEARLRAEAKKIAEKYIAPPHSTDFAVLFLPTEGLYAEVIRRPGLFEALQREHRVTLTGPTTLAALLNSLRMGFRTLAIEKRSSEVWQILGAVRTEFGKFGGVLDAVQKQITTVGNTLEKAGVRTRALERKLRGVEALDAETTQKLLGDLGPSEADDDNA
ncbi:MAG TPA: DNA recombination protein RmuC [Xanthomonadaceae bacterium]|nr:DNA recombination protein RmuC [Xanthomonadaceae bacterium]